jgi:hypothetical protein
MKPSDIQHLIVLMLFLACAIIFGWATRTEALLCMIFIVLAHVLRVLCEIRENIKNNHEKDLES